MAGFVDVVMIVGLGSLLALLLRSWAKQTMREWWNDWYNEERRMHGED